MKTKHLFYTLALSAAFAACSQEEIVSQQEIASADLSNRPVAGKVVLDFGLESRGTLAEDGEFNSIEFVKGEDGFGARLIDTYNYKPNYTNFGDHPSRNYDPSEYAATNYKYVNAGGNAWETDALMVEGNYLFYYPYNEANLARTPNTVYLPMTQTVSVELPNQPIKDLYEGENPAIVGYAFLKAEGQEATVKPELNHIFSYPQFTFVNEYTEKVFNGRRSEDVAKEITISKVVISYADGFSKKGTINHANFIKSFRNFALSEVKYRDEVKFPEVKKGYWAMGKSLLLTETATEDFVDWSDAAKDLGSIEVVFDGGLTLQPEEEFAFNVVMPAGEYEDANLTFTVYTDDNKMFANAFKVDPNNYKTLRFAPGLRYPAEEYNNLNTNPTVKPSKGTLGTVTIKGSLEDLVDPVAIIDNAEEFEAFLNSVADNSAWVTEVENLEEAAKVENGWAFVLADNGKEGVADMQITAEVMDLIKTYLSKGGVNFKSTMEVVGATETRAAEVVALDQVTFNEVQILSGDVTAANVTANTVTVLDGTLTVPSTYAGDKLGSITVYGGELILNQANFITKTSDNAVVITHVLDANGNEISAGKLTVNKSQGLRGDNSHDNFNMEAGELEINGQYTVVDFGGSAYTDISGGKVVNNATIKLNANYTIANGVTLENNGSINLNGFALNNNGAIETSKNLTINENKGTITPTVNTIKVTVASGNGTVDNTELAKVTANDDQIVSAEISNFEALKNIDAVSGVNKVIVTGDLYVNESATFCGQTKDDTFDYVEFKGGNLYLASGVVLNMADAHVTINADTEWVGRDAAASYITALVFNVATDVKSDANGEKYEFDTLDITIGQAPASVTTEIL